MLALRVAGWAKIIIIYGDELPSGKLARVWLTIIIIVVKTQRIHKSGWIEKTVLDTADISDLKYTTKTVTNPLALQPTPETTFQT